MLHSAVTLLVMLKEIITKLAAHANRTYPDLAQITSDQKFLAQDLLFI